MFHQSLVNQDTIRHLHCVDLQCRSSMVFHLAFFHTSKYFRPQIPLLHQHLPLLTFFVLHHIRFLFRLLQDQSAHHLLKTLHRHPDLFFPSQSLKEALSVRFLMEYRDCHFPDSKAVTRGLMSDRMHHCFFLQDQAHFPDNYMSTLMA